MTAVALVLALLLLLCAGGAFIVGVPGLAARLGLVAIGIALLAAFLPALAQHAGSAGSALAIVLGLVLASAIVRGWWHYHLRSAAWSRGTRRDQTSRKRRIDVGP